MEKTETLEEFYKHKFNWLPGNLQKDIGHVNVFRLEDCVGPGKEPVQYSRRDRAIRLTTGKTTSDHIFERLAGEARALLKHTPWNISEISYCLGFEEPAHFNHFFKKHTSMTPSEFRLQGA